MQKKKILVIDDDELILAVLRDKLSGEGYEVITATSGQSGLEKIETHSPDLIVTDVMLADIDGHKICRFVKQTKKLKTPVIIMTDKVEGASPFKIFPSHPDAFTTKSNRGESVIEEIKKLI
ncbi:MAG: response regulator [Candidatus Omnitrophota bacterium]